MLRDTIADDLRVQYHMSMRFDYRKTAFPPLFSRPFTVIAVVTHGQIEIAFDGHGKPLGPLGAGSALVLPANLRRRARALSPRGAGFIAAGYLFEVRGGLDLLNFASPPVVQDRGAAAGLRALIEELLRQEARPEAAPVLRSVFRQRIGYALLETVLRVAAPPVEALALRRVLPAVDYLNAHYAEPLDMAALVGRAGLSRAHFFRLFKAHTGATPAAFLMRRRLREAMLLLRQGALSVGQVGAAVGCPDPYHFSKWFKSAVGVPPSAFKQGRHGSQAEAHGV